MNTEQREELRSLMGSVSTHVHNLQKRLEQTDEDSYATRNELHDEVKQFGFFRNRMDSVGPNHEVDLTMEVVDYGYDPEAAACDQMCGLEHVSDLDRQKECYGSCLAEMEDGINNLQALGFTVKTGVVSVDPPEYRIDAFEEEACRRDDLVLELECRVKAAIHQEMDVWERFKTRMSEGIKV